MTLVAFSRYFYFDWEYQRRHHFDRQHIQNSFKRANLRKLHLLRTSGRCLLHGNPAKNLQKLHKRLQILISPSHKLRTSQLPSNPPRLFHHLKHLGKGLPPLKPSNRVPSSWRLHDPKHLPSLLLHDSRRRNSTRTLSQIQRCGQNSRVEENVHRTGHHEDRWAKENVYLGIWIEARRRVRAWRV